MFDGLPLVQLTPSVLLGLGVLLILTGRLIPRPQHQELRADYRKLLESTDVQARQLEKLLAHAETTNQLLREIPHPNDERERRR